MSLVSIDEMIAKGMGRAMTVGAFSTGIVGGGAGTVLDLDQPEFAIGVPAGYCIRPFFIEVVVQGGISTADSDETELLVGVDSLGLLNIASAETCTIETPSNLRTDLDKGSLCRTASAFTADMVTYPGNNGSGADPVIDMELLRVVETADQGGTAANVAYRLVRGVYQPNYPPFLVGPCTLLGYWGGTIATVGGFAIIHWVEGRTADLLPAVAGL